MVVARPLHKALKWYHKRGDVKFWFRLKQMAEELALMSYDLLL
jgi:hypothetical protein